MKLIKYLPICFLLLNLSASAQMDSLGTVNKKYPLRKVTTEPAIGIRPYPTSDLQLTNLIQWNVKRHFGVISYTSYAYNNAFHRKFNYIRNDYNYSIGQRFGVGTTGYWKGTSHTFSLLAGIKYDAFKETLNNPGLEKMSASLSSTSPDLGLMYNLKIGKKKYFFSYRMYFPLYPYPVKTRDVWSFDGNLANISLEFGVGIRIK